MLDGSHLTYFEEFDPVQNKPKKQKGSLSVRGAKIEQVVKHHTREYCFGITRENGSLLMVSAETKDDRMLWMEALDKGISGVSGRLARSLGVSEVSLPH